MLDNSDTSGIIFVMRELKSTTDSYSSSFHQDPFNDRQYLACLHKFDTKEIVDGYTVQELEDVIEFLIKVQTEIRYKNTCLQTFPLFSGTLE